ncbi:hypothetical protein AVEN_164743-1 [Araneus ventricosus]|uniref:Integrase zinc-binding domain-containing protein n=1 Tax=Araneus ventricosus TaxID=182803 RepID=A0A4Y2HJV8_ARAVE|nr:hypothetical protein AVEN_164743-1 [Araneus ventricosus]
MHDVMLKEDDISLFLVSFERQAKIMNIPAENQVAQLISLLPPDIVQLIAREPEEDAKKHDEEDRNKEAEMEQSEEMTHFEIDEEILPQADEEYKEIKKLIEVDSKEFTEYQHQNRDLTPLLNEAQTENSSKPNDFKIKENGMLAKKKIDKNEDERELIVVPEKYRDKIKSLCNDSTSGHLGIVKTKDRLAR